VMLFAGLISAFMIVRANAVEWPPPGQPRLPAGETAVNTAALLASGATLLYANRAYKVWPSRASRPLAIAIALGAFFVVFQGFEWLALIREGLTLTSSAHGSFFYLIVGTHALHAVAALIALGWAWSQLSRRKLRHGALWAVSLFWYFVVGVWPILYLRVYL
jgi:cytochrome c oxidase subunit 3